MSRQFAVVPWRLLTDERVGPTPKLVGATLCGFTNKAGVCWPSVETLAGLCKLDTRTIQRALVVLEEHGHLRRWVGQGRGHTTLYQVLYDTPAEAIEKVAGAPPIPEKVAPQAVKGGAGATQKDDKNTPTTTPSRVALSVELEEAIAPYILHHSKPDSLRLSVRAHLLGPAYPIASEAVVAEAIRQMAANSERWNVLMLAKYVQRLVTSPNEVREVGGGGRKAASANAHEQLTKLSAELREKGGKA